uniref:Uncharacterized protein n=1 Tax=Anopheles coluzzii TaxID=1518534 RepID=A0A8W7Q1U5_ANOCL
MFTFESDLERHHQNPLLAGSNHKQCIVCLSYFTHFNPGDGVPALFEADWDSEWAEWSWVDDPGRSGSESTRGLIGGTLELRISSSSASPVTVPKEDPPPIKMNMK